MSKDIIRIAVDGPGGAGKSTIAKMIAKRLDIEYIDTGAMYRAFGYKMAEEGVKEGEMDRIVEVLSQTRIDFDHGKTILDGKDVSDKIRTPEMSMQASIFSKYKEVREKLVALQQEMAKSKSVIMDGRDIGTVVLKDAEFKFFITASAEERAKRRYKELVEKGEKVSFESVLKDIEERDYNDTHRDVTPLRQADDAILVDTTSMTIEQVIDYVCSIIEK